MKTEEPAFPQGMPEHGSMPGLTKRELFSIIALHGLICDPKRTEMLGDTLILKSAIDLADQLMEKINES